MRWTQAWEEIVELVFPPRCAVCDTLGEPPLCPSCTRLIEWLEAPWCRCCGRPLMPTADAAMTCGECRAEPPRVAAARAVGLHSGVLRRAVLRLKFARHRELLRPLGRLLVERLLAPEEPDSPLDPSRLDGLVPVVLHPRRRGWRGFDQAVLLARQMAGTLELPVLERALVRVKDTPPQVGLSLPGRRNNMRGAFSVSDRETIRGRELLLLDDVYTTGSTLEAAARVLLRAGAARVSALTLTRAVPSWYLGPPASWGDEEDRLETA